MENTAVKLCIVCGLENGSDKPGDCDEPLFSKDPKLIKFCGELELSLIGDDPFTAFDFLHQLDKCSNFVIVCEECSQLINESVDKRKELEEVECAVLELQIELLVKLKELEGVSRLYFGHMGKIVDKVKGSKLSGLKKSVFGGGKGKCDMLGFRTSILNVGTSQTIFQDNLNSKLCRDQNSIPENNPKVMESSSPPPSPPKWTHSMDDSSNDLDKQSLPSPLPPLSPDLDNDTEPILEEIKFEETDDKPQKDNRTPRRKQARMNRRKLSQVDWSIMGPLKTMLIKGVVIGQLGPKSADNPISKYKWTYSSPTDQLQFADYPIQITELENNTKLVDIDGGEGRLTLSCNENHHQDNLDVYQVSCNFPANLSVKEKRRKIYVLQVKIRDHVLSLHLNDFTCHKCPEAQREKWKTLKQFKEHLKSHKSPNVCEICGNNFSSLSSLRRHRQQIHASPNVEQVKQEKRVEKLRSFQCSVCGEGFTTLIILRKHEETHKPKEMRERVHCSFCGKEILKICYPMHKKHYCPQQARNVRMDCKICGKSYKNGKCLGDHLMRKHKFTERPKF